MFTVVRMESRRQCHVLPGYRGEVDVERWRAAVPTARRSPHQRRLQGTCRLAVETGRTPPLLDRSVSGVLAYFVAILLMVRFGARHRYSGSGAGIAVDTLLVRLPAAALPGRAPGQVVHARASVTKQYNLVPAKGKV